MKIGPVVDLKNYREYSTRFEKCFGEALSVAEIHLLHSDTVSRDDFFTSIQESSSYFRDMGLEKLAYHLLDDVINDVILHDLIGHGPEFIKLIPPTDPAVAKDQLKLLMEAMELASGRFGQEIIAVVHEGVFLNTMDLESMEPDLLPGLRKLFFDKIENIHSRYFSNHSDGVAIYLENSPPFRGTGIDVQHFTDQLVVDIVPRLRDSEKIVFDVSHGFMCRHYFESKERDAFGLNLFRKLFWDKGNIDVPMNDYPEISAIIPFIGWIHLNDCSGIYGDQEGLPLFQMESLVDWTKMIPLLKKMDMPMILEIRSAEKDFSFLEKSLKNFRETWEAK